MHVTEVAAKNEFLADLDWEESAEVTPSQSKVGTDVTLPLTWLPAPGLVAMQLLSISDWSRIDPSQASVPSSLPWP